MWSAGFPRGFAVAVCVQRAARGIGDVVHVAGEWVTYEAVAAVEAPVGITHQSQGRRWHTRPIATVAGQFAGLVTGLGGAVGVAGPAHGVDDVVEITGFGSNCVGGCVYACVGGLFRSDLRWWVDTFYSTRRKLRMRSRRRCVSSTSSVMATYRILPKNKHRRLYLMSHT